MAAPPIQPPPTLATKHSGLPDRLLALGTESKARLLSNRTLPESVPRRGELPRLPPDTTRAEFDQAIAELKQILGDEHVEINDKPLVDGWYVEHPYVAPPPQIKCVI
jgi:hypothetical protein